MIDSAIKIAIAEIRNDVSKEDTELKLAVNSLRDNQKIIMTTIGEIKEKIK